MLSHPSGMTVSSRDRGVLSDALRAHRNRRRTRWRKLARRAGAARGRTPAQGRDLPRPGLVILDGTLLRIDRVGRTSGYDRAFYSGKHKAHG